MKLDLQMLFKKRRKLNPNFITVSFSIDRIHISVELLDQLIMRLEPWFYPAYFFDAGELKSFNRKSFEGDLKGSIHSKDKDQSMAFVYPYHLSSPFVIEFDIYSENFNNLSAVMDLLLNLDGFYVAYAFNKEDSFIQNNSNVFFYKERNISIPNDMLIKDRYGDIRVDVRRNPGRRVLIDKMWLMSAWQMWFGRKSYVIFDKEKLLSFQGAKLIEESSNCVHIQLYNNHYDADKNQCRKIQQQFRDWMRMDEIEKNFNE